MTKTYVHRNLNRGCWSTLLRGKLQGYRQNITLRDVEFRVRPAGHRRALREGRRNVHAFGVGFPSRGIPSKKPTLVRYNRERGQFVDHDGRHILGAHVARFSDDGLVRIFDPVYAPLV